MKLIAGSIAMLYLAGQGLATDCAAGTKMGNKPTLTARTNKNPKYCISKPNQDQRDCYAVDAEDNFVDAAVESVDDKKDCKALGGAWKSIQTGSECATRTCVGSDNAVAEQPALAQCASDQRRGWTYHYQENSTSKRCKPDRSLNQWEKVCVPKCGADQHLVSRHENGVCQEPTCTDTLTDEEKAANQAANEAANNPNGLDCNKETHRTGPSVYQARGKGTYCMAMDKGSNTACVPKCGSGKSLRSKAPGPKPFENPLASAFL